MTTKKNRAYPTGPVSSQKFDVVAFDGGTVTLATVKILTVACVGVKATDMLIAAASVQKAGLVCTPSRVQADGVVEITIANPTAGTITTGTVSYTFCVEHFTI